MLKTETVKPFEDLMKGLDHALANNQWLDGEHLVRDFPRLVSVEPIAPDGADDRVRHLGPQHGGGRQSHPAL